MKNTYFELRELRAKGKTIVGRIPYGSKSEDLGGFREILQVGCFSESIKSGTKVMSLWNHDSSMPLGSTDNGTLKLYDKRDGLHFTIMPPKTSYSEDALELIKSGTITGASFGFNVSQESWDRKNSTRYVERASIFEISPCSFPAYEKTSVSVRAKIKQGENVMDLQKIKDLHDEKLRLVEKVRDNRTPAEEVRRIENDLEKIDGQIRAMREAEDRERIAAMYGTDADDSLALGNRGLNDSQSEKRVITSNSNELRGYFEPRADAKCRITPEALNLKGNGQELSDLRAYLRGGKLGIPEATRQRFEQRALQSDLDTAGGYLTGEQMAAQVIMSLENMVFIRRLATVLLTPNADSLGCPTLDNDPDDPVWTAEIQTGDEDSTMSFEKRSITPHPLAKRIKASKKLIRVAPHSEKIVRGRLAYKFGTTEENAFLNGGGANEPLGLLVASDAGIGTSRDTTTAALKADDIIDCYYSLKSQYRTNAKWIWHRDGIKACRQLKDGEGNYLWQPGLTAGAADLILGKPYFESEYMPAYSSGNYVAICGDFSFYWIADSMAMTIQVLIELYAETNQNGYIGRKETDGMPVLSEAFARLELS